MSRDFERVRGPGASELGMRVGEWGAAFRVGPAGPFERAEAPVLVRHPRAVPQRHLMARSTPWSRRMSKCTRTPGCRATGSSSAAAARNTFPPRTIAASPVAASNHCTTPSGTRHHLLLNTGAVLVATRRITAMCRPAGCPVAVRGPLALPFSPGRVDDGSPRRRRVHGSESWRPARRQEPPRR